MNEKKIDQQIQDKEQSLQLEVRFVDGALLRPLRHSVLRADLPYETTLYDGDYLESTSHAAVFAGTDYPIAIGTIVAQPFSEEPDAKAFQLRGMAVDPKYRGTGAGKLALAALEVRARELQATLIWCKARTSAVGFYERAGWAIVSEEYQLPQFGPHYSMLKRI